MRIPSTPPTSPPCLIMLGGLGDLLIALPIARYYAELLRAPTPVLTSARYQNVLFGCSYVKPVGYSGGPWSGYEGAIEWARKRFDSVYPLHVGEPAIRDFPQTTHFCHEQYLHAGVPGRYGDFPLIFDRRNPAREAKLLARVRGTDPRPLFLYNLEGRSSPFAGSDALLASLTARWGAKLKLVNVSRLDLSHFQDLLALLAVSVGMLSIDTSTIHLMPASATPYIALVNDTKTQWWSSVPRGNCVLELGYTEALPALDSIHDVIADMLAAGVGGTVRRVKREAIRRAAPVVAVQPHLITLACDGMESVWRVAERTWKPWCAARGLSLETHTRAPRPDLAPSWNKVALMLAALEKREVVWWIDSDMTVARSDATLPSLTSDLTFSSDWNGLCAAMFAARSTPWAKGFLAAALLLGDVRDPDAFGKGCGVKWEQNAFKTLLREFPSCATHVSFLPRDLVADRDHRTEGAASFNHFGALSNKARIAAMRRVHKLR